VGLDALMAVAVSSTLARTPPPISLNACNEETGETVVAAREKGVGTGSAIVRAEDHRDGDEQRVTVTGVLANEGLAESKVPRRNDLNSAKRFRYLCQEKGR